MPELEEFMIFENDDGANGVIIKCNNHWWKCYKNNDCGQTFNKNDIYYNSIKKLYKCKKGDDYTKFNALKFMRGEDYRLEDYNCVYDRIIKQEPIINNYTINISVPNNISTEEVIDLFNKQLRNQLNITS